MTAIIVPADSMTPHEFFEIVGPMFGRPVAAEPFDHNAAARARVEKILSQMSPENAALLRAEYASEGKYGFGPERADLDPKRRPDGRFQVAA